MDPLCCAALLTVAAPALPAPLVEHLERWGELDPEQQDRTRRDLQMMAMLMRRAR